MAFSSTAQWRGKPTEHRAGRHVSSGGGTQRAQEREARDCRLSSPGRRGCCLTRDLPSPVWSSQVRWDLYLVSLFTSRNWAGKRLLLPSVHAHGAEDGLGADGALGGPGLIAVRLLVVHLLLVVLAACRVTEQGLLGAVTSPQVHSGPRGQEEPGTQGQDGQLLLPWERAFQHKSLPTHLVLGQAWWEGLCVPI